MFVAQVKSCLTMGSPADLTLGRPSDAFKSVPTPGDQLERMLRAEKYMNALEDERKKIEAFKRELPFCMQLLSDAIEASKVKLADCEQRPLKRQVLVSRNLEEDSNVANTNRRPILEEFIPLRNPSNDSSFEDTSEERENRTCEYPRGDRSNGLMQTKFWVQEEEGYAHGRKMFSSMMEKPYKKRESLRMGQASACSELPNQSLPVGDGEVSPCGELFNPGRGLSVEGSNHSSKELPNTTASNTSGQACSPPQRKARRCWSPELHRRFVNALQQLGGPDVATPKQIREHMKVDGLTNDEVKSHLQKYRLHTRRPNPAGFQPAAAHAPQLVVLGGIWVPSEYAAHAAAAAQQAPQALYSSTNQQALQLHQPPFPQGHYTQLNATPHLQLDPSLSSDGQQAAASHSQSSSHGHLQLTGHSSGHSSDTTGREGSAREDGNEGSSWKALHQDKRFHEAEENGDTYEGNLYAHKWRHGNDSGEDDSEGEDRRLFETGV